MSRIMIQAFKCERCGHVWVPRQPKDGGEIVMPKVCPTCKSPYWDTPRRQKS